ncbi:hypothetical protein CEXT_391441 [Caerostris extrusa]|uniref:Uncharacterized protein n=1 Tax=Caerostris extrusa TaxID=172846 RepID=A0AAV4UHT4_CAEEX|nr:hypothetical protein CEXT_391441 [Caerostris extrusa]
MEGHCLSCYVLVFTLLSCVVVSKGGGYGSDGYGGLPAGAISIRYGRVLAYGGYGYELQVPEVVTNNTVESLLSACSNSSTCQGNRMDDAVYDYYCNCDDSCVKVRHLLKWFQARNRVRKCHQTRRRREVRLSQRRQPSPRVHGRHVQGERRLCQAVLPTREHPHLHSLWQLC